MDIEQVMSAALSNGTRAAMGPEPTPRRRPLRENEWDGYVHRGDAFGVSLLAIPTSMAQKAVPGYRASAGWRGERRQPRRNFWRAGAIHDRVPGLWRAVLYLGGPPILRTPETAFL